jgi:hypothetical protein
MTAKEKAEALFRAMYWPMFKIRYNGGEAEKREAAKQCATIAADEILNCGNNHDGYITCDADYWKQVKTEIEKL